MVIPEGSEKCDISCAYELAIWVMIPVMHSLYNLQKAHLEYS